MKVQSLFSVAMAVTGVSSVPADPRLSFTPDTPPLLTPAATSHLGHLTWDAQLLMASDNYLGVSQNTSGNWGLYYYYTVILKTTFSTIDAQLLVDSVYNNNNNFFLINCLIFLIISVFILILQSRHNIL